MNLALRVAARLPLLGPALRDAVGGKANGFYLLLAYGALALVGLVYRFGYPFLIVTLLAATAACLLLLLVLTAGDVVTGRTSRDRPTASRKRR